MNRFAGGIAFLLLAACGENPPPAPASEKKAPPAPMMEAKQAPKPVEEPVEKKPAPPAGAKKKERSDSKGRAKSPELFKKFMALMEENGDLLQSIEADVEKKSGEAVIKPKVSKLLKNGEAAKALQYRKDPDQERELEDDFDLFLFKMKNIEKAVWDADSGKELLENLSTRCTVCHDKFQ